MGRRDYQDDSDVENFCPDDPEFFHKAPAKIGELLSLHTSLSEFDEPTPFVWRFLKATLIAGLIEFVIVVVFVILFFIGAKAGPLVLLGVFVGTSLLNVLLVFGIVLLSPNFVHFCGYVGKEGAAYYGCKGSRDNLNVKKVFLYEDARDLRIAITHHYYNGAYTQTTFSYRWTDEDGNEVFSIVDAHQSQHNYPPRTHVYFFALETEEAWSQYLLEQISRKLKKGGAHKFHLSGDNYLLLRRNSLKLSLRGNVQEFDEEDLDEIEIANGHIAIKEPGSKKGWFTDTGIHRFAFADLSNARVFLLLLNRMFGVPIT